MFIVSIYINDDEFKWLRLYSYVENENKDLLFEYIEDLFYNIDTIELTPNGFEFEIMCFKFKKI